MIWLTIAQFIFAIGTFLLIKELIRNRNILKGYSLFGSFLTWLAMTFVLVQFWEFSDWIGLVFGFVQWLFWLFVTIFVLRQKIKERKEKCINS